MGFFGWKCPECHRSVLAEAAVDPDFKDNVPHEYCECTLVTQVGTIEGTYGGYGNIETRVGSIAIAHTKKQDVKLYHTKCYAKAGSPNYLDAKACEWAKDQGFFIDSKEYKEKL